MRLEKWRSSSTAPTAPTAPPSLPLCIHIPTSYQLPCLPSCVIEHKAVLMLIRSTPSLLPTRLRSSGITRDKRRSACLARFESLVPVGLPAARRHQPSTWHESHEKEDVKAVQGGDNSLTLSPLILLVLPSIISPI